MCEYDSIELKKGFHVSLFKIHCKCCEYFKCHELFASICLFRIVCTYLYIYVMLISEGIQKDVFITNLPKGIYWLKKNECTNGY